MKIKTMESKREMFKEKREEILDQVISTSAKYGFTAHPKKFNVKESHGKLADILVETWEFTGEYVFVFYERGTNLTKHIDIDGNPVTGELKIYTIENTPNYRDVYMESDFANRTSGDQPFRVPKADFVPLDTTYLRKMKPESVYGKTGHIPFPDLQVDSTFVEMEDEHVSKLTISDLIAISMEAPVSNKDYVNKRILQAIAIKNANRTKN
jgi:hypothetical protein